MPRFLEVVIALSVLIVSIPFLLAGTVLVGLDLGFPIMFRQVRAGFGRRPITLCKLRTMRNDRDRAGRLLADDDRVTSVGRALRRSRLDEVPQLLAVLKGDLALVGPRPLLPETIAAFGQDGSRRCQVRPGLTGWAQVNGNTRLGDREKLHLDLWYVDHRGTALDLLILWMTVTTLLRGESRSETRIHDAQAWCAGTAVPGSADRSTGTRA